MRKNRPAGMARSEGGGAQPDQRDIQELMSLYNAGRTGEAEKKAARLARKFPGSLMLLNILGAALAGQGKFRDAASVQRRVVKIKPDYAEAHYNLGIALRELGQLERAAASFRQAAALKPALVEAHGNLGVVLQALGDLEEASASFRHAVELRPDLADAHNNLGVALKDMGRPGEAEGCFRRALAIAPGSAEAFNNLGLALKDLGRFDEAVASFHQALGAKPDHASAQVNLGTAFLELGQTEDAIATYRKAIELQPEFAEAMRFLAGATRHRGHDGDIERMEALYSRPDCSPGDRMHLAFGLGMAFDDLKEYDRAFDYFREGNRLKKKTVSFPVPETTAFFQRLRDLFGADFFTARRGARCGGRTPIFILGMPRSGTSLVEQILASHPEVFGAGELYDLEAAIRDAFAGHGLVYPDGLDTLPDAALREIGESYVKRIQAHGGGAPRVTDKMPHNFLHIGLIAAILPDAAIVHMRRNPMDNCLSLFTNYFDSRHPYAYDLKDLGTYYRLYDGLMEHWRRVVPDAMLDLSYEELVDSPEEQTRRLLEHCALEFDPACLEFHKTDRPVRTVSAWQVRQPLYRSSLERWRRYETQLEPLRRALEK